MFSPRHSGASAYAKVGVQTQLEDATPYQVVAALYRGARGAIATARMHMRNGAIAEKGEAIGKALLIIGGGLKQGLNMEVGGELPQRLSALYDYMARRLLEANLNNDDDALAEVDRLLGTLEDGWAGIGPEVAKLVAAGQLPARAEN